MNPLELVRRTPKSNCGKCGQPTCLAFAALAAKGLTDPAQCPFIDLSGLEITSGAAAHRLEDAGRERDLQLVEHLQGKVSTLDFTTIAPALGVSWRISDPDAMEFAYLGQRVLLKKTALFINGKKPEDPRDQILVCNYVYSTGGREPSGNWIGLESLPNSISKVKTLRTYCEDRLAALFDGSTGDRIAAAAERMGGRPVSPGSADIAFIIPVLPNVPQQILYWAAEPEDGFEAKVKVLFDQHVMDFLDLESLVFSAERMADKFSELLT